MTKLTEISNNFSFQVISVPEIVYKIASLPGCALEHVEVD